MRAYPVPCPHAACRADQLLAESPSSVRSWRKTFRCRAAGFDSARAGYRQSPREPDGHESHYSWGIASYLLLSHGKVTLTLFTFTQPVVADETQSRFQQ